MNLRIRSVGVALLILLTCLAVVTDVAGQITISSTVSDSLTGEGIPYCHVAISGTTEGAITNAEGSFQIEVGSLDDILLISYIGYQTRSMTAEEVRSAGSIRLNPMSISLEELTVYASDAFLYDAVAKCGRVMRDQPARRSKAYMTVETSMNEEPIEFLECFYNAQSAGASVDSLLLKNGRVGLPISERYFFNFQTSLALIAFDITDKRMAYPGTPLQFNSKKMQRVFKLVGLPSFTDTNTLHISFEPIEERRQYFSGELWIDKRDHTLKKIEMVIGNADTHPFDLMMNTSRIDKFAFKVVQSYKKDDSGVFMDYFTFEYDLNMWHYRDEHFSEPWFLHSTSFLHFYDHGDEFILPYLKYEGIHDDYRRISFLPYDSTFWEHHHGYVFTEDQKRTIDHFADEGMLINHYRSLGTSEASFYEHNNAFWSAKDRVEIKYEEPEENRYGQRILSELYNIEVKLFLDVNVYGEDIDFNTATILDVYDSYNYIGNTPLRTCFVNIYFDLCEIARRQMVQKLNNAETTEEIEDIYYAALRELNDTLDRYTHEVQQGKDERAFREWNAVVFDTLGIDNISVFGLAETE